MNRRRRRQLAFNDFPGDFSGARISSDNHGVKMKGSKLGRLPRCRSLYKYQKLMERSEAGI